MCLALFALPAVGFIVVVTILVIKSRGNNRSKDLRVLADRINFTFDAGPDHEFYKRYPDFVLFNIGFHRHATNTMSGVMELGGRPLQIYMGDFYYKINDSNRVFNFVIAQLPWEDIPGVSIRSEHIFDRMASMVGFDDIDFESDEFSRRFLVRSKDRKFAYSLLDPRMMEFLLSSSPPSIDLQRGAVCLSRWGPFSQHDDFMSTLTWLGRFLDEWPEHLVRSLQKDSV